MDDISRFASHPVVGAALRGSEWIDSEYPKGTHAYVNQRLNDLRDLFETEREVWMTMFEEWVLPALYPGASPPSAARRRLLRLYLQRYIGADGSP